MAVKLQVLFTIMLLVFSLTAQSKEFALKDMQGLVHRLPDYRGKWVLVNFWATWCSPCLD